MPQPPDQRPSTEARETVRVDGRDEKILRVERVGGRSYFVLGELSRRGAVRVFDRRAGPGGDLRVLHFLSGDRASRHRLESIRRLAGPGGARSFPRVTDCARRGGQWVVAVEWVRGVNLREYLAGVREGTTPRPSVREAVRLCRGLAHGLSHYHRRMGVVHGDVSPANLVLTSGTTQLVLIDFGSAWPVEHAAEKLSGDGVTPPYAAPERMARDAREDFRSDIFSLGVVAYELLSLEIPFEGLGGQAGLSPVACRTGGIYRPVSELLRGPSKNLPAAARKSLDDALQKSLALTPDDRFLTTRAWRNAWDRVYDQLRPGGRLLGWRSWVARWWTERGD